MRARAAGAGRARRLVVLVLACVVVLVGAVTSPAEAHAYLVSSNPADGSRLEAAPARLELSFSEHVVPQATRITVVDTAGHPVALTGMHLVTSDATDTEEPATIVAAFARPLRAAAYRISWETLSSDDLHRTAGVLVFGVGRTVQAGSLHETAPPADETTLRTGFLLGLALALGGLLAGHVARRAGAASRRPRQLATWGGVLALGASVLLLVTQLVRAHAGLPATLVSAYGVRWGVRSVGLLVLLAGVRLEGRRGRRTLVGLGGTLTCLGTASLGHAASGASTPTRLVADAAHVAATLSWGGAVLCLAVVVLTDRASSRTGSLGVGATLRAFAGPAAACLSVAVVTGVYLSSWVVGSVDAALLTSYGRILLLKLAVAGAAAGLGLVNHLRLRHGSGDRLPRLTVPAEALAVAGVVLLTAVLTSSQPATEPTFVRDPVRADSVPAVGRLADLEVSAGLRPNRPGDAIAVVDVFDTRRPAPATITGVTLALAGQPAVEAQPLGDGHWSAPVTASGGATSIRVRVRRAGEADAVGSFAWTVASGRVPRPVTVSQAPLRPPLLVLSASLGTVLALTWAAALLLRARRSTRREPARHVELHPAA